MTEVLQSVKFLDIDKLTHKFPADVQDLGISVTLLHNHSHAPPKSFLVYKKDFSISTYETNTSHYVACSWYWENEQIIAY